MPYRFRLASRIECALLPDIEARAATLFRSYANITGLSAEQLTHTNSIAEFETAQSAGLLWVAVDDIDVPIGFALVRRFDDVLHLHEFDVHPAHARRGVGRSLLSRVVESARAQNAAAMTLTTYRDIPWNAPFYRSLGFVELLESEWTPALRSIRDYERSMGWRLEARVAMRLDLSGG